MFLGYESSSETKFPPLSLAYIAALTPDDWEVEILDENFKEAKYKPCDLVGITLMTVQAERAYHFAREFKKNNVPVIMGGIHPSMATDEALQFADSVVIGEADTIWPEVIKDFENGELKKVYKENGKIVLSELVTPKSDLFDSRYKWGALLTSMGCPFKCEFCSVTAFNGGVYRQRPVQDVLDELSNIKQRFVLFVDANIFGYTKEHAGHFIEMCKGIIDLKLNKYWISQASLNICENEEALYYAKKSGCCALVFGFESPDINVLKGNMNKKMNVKYIEKPSIVRNMNKYGIAILGSFIVGNDEDTLETFDDIFDFINEVKIDIPNIYFSTPHPGTQLRKRRIEEGNLVYNTFPEDWKYYNSTTTALCNSKNFGVKEINLNTKRLAEKVYAYRQIIKRGWRTLLHSKSIVIALSSIRANLNYRIRHFNSPYFTEEL